jgi:hypothetical protein
MRHVAELSQHTEMAIVSLKETSVKIFTTIVVKPPEGIASRLSLYQVSRSRKLYTKIKST